MSEQELKMTIAKNLAAYRKLNNLTQLELAEKLNYSDKSVSKWERGDGLPDILVLKTIADFYGITVNDFMLNGKPKKHRTVRHQQILIPLLSVAFVWLIATVVYMVLKMLPFDLTGEYLSFIYAIPASMAVLTFFSAKWWYRLFTLLTVSGLVWGVALCLFLSISVPGIGIIWSVATVMQVIVILWFFIVLRPSGKFKTEKKTEETNEQ